MSKDSDSTKKSKKSKATEDTATKPNALGYIFATLLLRLWLGVRAIQTGIEKYASTTSSSTPVKIDGQVYDENFTTTATAKVYALDQYHGIPKSMKAAFAKEPLMTDTLLKYFDMLLGPVLIILGTTILLGLASRVSLFLLGLLYISLTWGLILIKQDAGVSYLGVHMIMIALALTWADHNRVCLLKKW